MKIKIKKLHENAVVPSYAKNGDAGMDLTAVSKSFDEDGNMVYGTGLAFEIPFGYFGLLFPRSSNAKKDLLLSNSVGVLDSGYRGEVLFKFKESSFDYYGTDPSYFGGAKYYEIGDRIGQILILPYPQIEFELTDNLSDSERGLGGYGSSGK
jgi:dUTP pyrophosphatase